MDKLKKRIQENIHKMDIDEPNAATWNYIKQGLSKPIESDPLKNIIAENKNELEIETPDAKSWEKISNRIKAKKPAYVQHIQKRIFYYLSAACILVVIGLGIFRYMNNVPKNQAQSFANKPALKNNNVDTIDTATIGPNKNQLTAASSLPGESLKQNIKHKNIFVASSRPAKKQQRKLLPPEVLQIQKDYDKLVAGQVNYTKHLALYGESASYFQEFRDDFKILENQEKELKKSIAQNGIRENSIDDLISIYQQKLTVLKKLQNEINKTSNRNKNLTDTIPTYLSL